MLNELIHSHEHRRVNSLTEEELIELLKNKNKLIQYIDLKDKYFLTGYYIGLTWIKQNKKALYITPKLDTDKQSIDYLKMLSISLKHPEILKHGDDLFEIYFNQPPVKIKIQHDLITPLLIVYFLQLVQDIVRKGLKKGYYKVERNLHSTIKGKVLISQTLKQNTFKNRQLLNICSFEEFGINHSENRIIKKALLFVMRYLKLITTSDSGLSPILNFIIPAFEKVDENISLNEVKKVKHNPFYTEYSKAVDLSITILKRFGYNLNFIKNNDEIEVPPFWINMPKIYEMYVLGKLKEAFGSRDIIYQANANYGDLDFLRITKSKELVIDAKYKPQYKTEPYKIEDVRQLSGYARDTKTLKALDIPNALWGNTVLNCLIIYPDQKADLDINEGEIFSTPINQFEKFYKLGISIPFISEV
jgi:hypothetical protein